MTHVNQYEDKELRDAVTEIVTGGVAQYYELENDVHTEMAMSPEFGARWSEDVLKEINELTQLITQKQLEADRNARIDELSRCYVTNGKGHIFIEFPEAQVGIENRIAELTKQEEKC